jgi:hypothetical protein
MMVLRPAISLLLTAAAGTATMLAQSSQPAKASAANPIVVFDVDETLLNFNDADGGQSAVHWLP